MSECLDDIRETLDALIINKMKSSQRCNSDSLACPPCSKTPPQNIYNLYNQVGINCFIAAAIYVVVGAVSLCQVRLNKRQEYMVT